MTTQRQSATAHRPSSKRVRAIVGGPLPDWSPDEWARIEADYERIVAEERAAEHRFERTAISRAAPSPGRPRTRARRTSTSRCTNDSAGDDDGEPPHEREQEPSEALLKFADALGDFLADLHLTGKVAPR